MAWEESRYKSLLSYWLAKIKVMKICSTLNLPISKQNQNPCSSRIFLDRVVWIKERSASIIHTVNDLQCGIFVQLFKNMPRPLCYIFYIKISSDSPFESSGICATRRRSGPNIFYRCRHTRSAALNFLLGEPGGQLTDVELVPVYS
jgi:hypothetical protein